jgi:hypothetical protein
MIFSNQDRLIFCRGAVPAPHRPPRIAMLRVFPVLEFRKHTFKSLHYILASMSCEQETLRVILQNKFDRIENLVQMNHAATLAVPSLLAAIWGIEGGLDNFRNAWILSIISIGLLLIWRYFAHCLDDDIVNHYIQIVKIENLMDIPPSLSLFEKRIDDYQSAYVCTQKNPDEEFFQTIKSLPPEQKLAFFNCLIQEKKLGARGHDKWDWVAWALSGILFLVIITTFRFFPFFLAIIIGIVFVLIMNPANYQRDPTIFDLKEAKKRMDSQLKED